MCNTKYLWKIISHYPDGNFLSFILSFFAFAQSSAQISIGWESEWCRRAGINIRWLGSLHKISLCSERHDPRKSFNENLQYLSLMLNHNIKNESINLSSKWNRKMRAQGNVPLIKFIRIFLCQNLNRHCTLMRCT